MNDKYQLLILIEVSNSSKCFKSFFPCIDLSNLKVSFKSYINENYFTKI